MDGAGGWDEPIKFVAVLYIEIYFVRIYLVVKYLGKI